MKKAKQATIPDERANTIRHEIISIIKGHQMSAKDISAAVGIPERDVYDHLEHIKKSLHKNSIHLSPAQCLKCGFVFKKRERLRKPGRCPICHAEKIQEPLFEIIERQ